MKVNTQSEQQLAAQFAICSIPTLKIFKGGNVVADMAGALSEQQLKQWLAEHI